LKKNESHSSTIRDDDNPTSSYSERIAKLASLIATYTPHDGRFDLSIPGLHVIKVSKTHKESIRSISPTGLCIVAQGAKQVMLGQNVYEYDNTHMVVYSMAVPITSNIVSASRKEPYLCFVLDIDPQKISELALKVYPHGLSKSRPDIIRAVYVEQTDIKVTDAAVRLMEMLAHPNETTLLAPLVIEEILIRLLTSPFGMQVAQIGMPESNTHKVVQAISWIQAHYAEPIQIDKLANTVNMSVSSFHQYFKAITSMSPLQFQKTLRLQEARHLMLSKIMDVSRASMQVGYASVSQFSREYSRFFGSSPTKDITKLLEQ
jgi:AraC-like DNA-binding protein